MSGRLAFYLVGIAMVVAALLLVLDLAYFAHGSLEAFPTEEQQSKVRVVTAVIAAMLILVEVGLRALLRRLQPGPT